MSITYREATRDDAALIVQFIQDLAVYEKLADQAVATEEDILKTVFDGTGRTFCMFAENGGETVGFCLGFYNYSTFQGKYGLYIEDVFVKESHRNKGVGKGFFKAVAQKALREDCGRVQWWVLDWNAPSIAFYEKMGAVPMSEWIVYRLEGETIAKVAKG